MYYQSSENKGADQLRGYREADLRLCFRLCRLLVFPWGRSNTGVVNEFNFYRILGMSFGVRFKVRTFGNKHPDGSNVRIFSDQVNITCRFTCMSLKEHS